MHGDLYAHNILINMQEMHCYFGDFGAATFYEGKSALYEKLEVRAFGCLLEDMLMHCSDVEDEAYHYLERVIKACMDEVVENRPRFGEIEL